ARVYYSDYSGNMGSDFLLSFYSFQLNLGIQKKLLKGHLFVEGDLRPGITATTVNWKSYRQLPAYSETTNEKYKSRNLALQPTITVGGRLGIIAVHGFVGYNLNVATGKLYQVNEANYLQLNGEAVHADWSGLRIGGGLSLYINQNKKKNGEEASPWPTSFGLGLGLDYGGIGCNVLTYPGQHIGIFGGVGYALAGIGTNGGIKLRIVPISSDKTSLYFTGMYGYNAAIRVANDTEHNRLFFGPTMGAGIDFRQTKNGYWSLALLVPVRSDEVNQYINSLKAMGVKMRNSLLPVAISVGYRFNRE
ncbi:MAG: hypothetical protein ABUL44_02995, partial [Flavobacterium sp.]